MHIVPFRAPTNPIHLALVVGLAIGGCFEDPPAGDDPGATDTSGASETGPDPATSLADDTQTVVDCPAASALSGGAFLSIGAVVEQVPVLIDDCTVERDAVSRAPITP